MKNNKSKNNNNFVLWEPSVDRVANSHIAKFCSQKSQLLPENLHKYSVEQNERFWSEIWDYLEIIGEKGQTIMAVPENTPEQQKMMLTRFFPQGKINYTQNLLKNKSSDPAIIFYDEMDNSTKVSFNKLEKEVTKLINHFKKNKIGQGNTVAGILPNIPQTISMMLATAAVGAKWCCCSPDFGVSAVLDRFIPVQPDILVGCSHYYYNGKKIQTFEKTLDVAKSLKCLSQIVFIPYPDNNNQTALSHSFRQLDLQVHQWHEILKNNSSVAQPYELFPFNIPMLVMFSSGTTGKPKCIVHGAGGTLIQHMKEHQLHCDIKKGDRVFFYTTCGWMMWNWLVSVLASGATIVIYDGSPVYQRKDRLFDIAEKEKISVFGTSATYIDTLRQSKISIKNLYSLTSLKTVLSTGSPLSPDNFCYVYENIKKNLHLCSISGGTDIVSCFVLGHPALPVRCGEIQTAGFGMQVEVRNDNGTQIFNEPGELSCNNPFPCSPLFMWDDPDHKKYIASYYDKFPGIWCHGDYAKQTENYGFIIYGRSDTTLNPSGVRIGSAEIYQQLNYFKQIQQAAAVSIKINGQEAIVLFVVMNQGHMLDQTLISKIKKLIKDRLSPRHVPSIIHNVPDLPRTMSGKTSEIAIKQVLNKIQPKNLGSLINPASLNYFKNLISDRL